MGQPARNPIPQEATGIARADWTNIIAELRAQLRDPALMNKHMR